MRFLSDPPFYYALIVALMFIASLIGGIGYILYYPMLFFICFYYNRGIKRNNIIRCSGFLLLV